MAKRLYLWPPFWRANCKFDRFGIGAPRRFPQIRSPQGIDWGLGCRLLACRKEGHRKALIIVQGPSSSSPKTSGQQNTNAPPQIPNEPLSPSNFRLSLEACSDYILFARWENKKIPPDDKHFSMALFFSSAFHNFHKCSKQTKTSTQVFHQKKQITHFHRNAFSFYDFGFALLSP